MTPAERNRRYRERHPERVLEAQRRYQAAKKKADSKQKRVPTEAQKMQQNKWGRATPGSVLAGMNKEERRAFAAWLKVLDKDLAVMELWGRTRA